MIKKTGLLHKQSGVCEGEVSHDPWAVCSCDKIGVKVEREEDLLSLWKSWSLILQFIKSQRHTAPTWRSLQYDCKRSLKWVVFFHYTLPEASRSIICLTFQPASVWLTGDQVEKVPIMWCQYSQIWRFASCFLINTKGSFIINNGTLYRTLLRSRIRLQSVLHF